MSISINFVCLLGRLTKDPEKRVTQSGLSTCIFTLAVDRKHKKDSDQEQTADFIQCVAWRQSADYLCSYGHKGDQASVTGRIQTRNYDDKDGRKVYVTEVVCDNVQLQSKGSYQGTASASQPKSSAEYRQQIAEEKAPNPYSMKSIKAACTSDPSDPLNQQMSADSMNWDSTGVNPDDLPF